MSSSSHRNFTDAYLKKRLCHICLVSKPQSPAEVIDCLYCNAVYHQACLDNFMRKDDADCCLSLNTKGDHICFYCAKPGAPLDQILGIPIHPVCRCQKDCLLNEPAIGTSDKCRYCSKSRGILVKCKGDSHRRCSVAFHVHCHQALQQQLPEPLRRCTSTTIVLKCSTCIDESEQEMVRRFKYYKEALESNPGAALGDLSSLHFSQLANSQAHVQGLQHNSTLPLDFSQDIEHEPATVRKPPTTSSSSAHMSKQGDSTALDLLAELDGKKPRSKQPLLGKKETSPAGSLLERKGPNKASKSASNKARSAKSTSKPDHQAAADDVLLSHHNSFGLASIQNELSPRELTAARREILKPMIDGLSNKEFLPQAAFQNYDFSSLKQVINAKFTVYADLLSAHGPPAPAQNTSPNGPSQKLTQYMTGHSEAVKETINGLLAQIPKPSNL
jgi:hypothetical protein